ncbi:hypothetical protein JCGZ_01400 [Jatropha curcas]|uniref:Uncharacterized protein n=1 Tax=Jatropha curcas TaxID=180498 RepID=A0A067LJQ4_JATCU|nr:hypothetical protein JCGZ_01400 [Jatropha curcas]
MREKEETEASSLIAGIGVACKSSELRRDFPIGRNRRFPTIAALAKDERRERGREAEAAVRRRRGKEVRRGGAGSGGRKNETKGRGATEVGVPEGRKKKKKKEERKKMRKKI